MFVVSMKCIDPWVLEFVVSNITGNNQWENCISLDFNVRVFSERQNPRKLEPRINNDFTVNIVLKCSHLSCP